MIKLLKGNITSIYIGNRGIISIFLGNLLIWSIDLDILSCYSKGYWDDEYPWTDDTSWID